MKLVRLLAVVMTIGFVLSAGGMAMASSGTAISLLETTPTPEPSVTPEPTDANQKVAQAIADEFDVDVAEIVALHQDGLGYGEIVKAYALAEISGKSVQEILAMKKEGMGWGEIAQELKVDPGKWEPNLGKVVSENKGKSEQDDKDKSKGNNSNDKDNGKENKDNGKGKNK